jgi:hypothetical protein
MDSNSFLSLTNVNLSPIVNKVKMTGPTSEVGTDTLPEHQSALPTCSGICAAQSLVLCVVIC